MKKIFFMLMLLTFAVSLNAQPRPRPHMRPSMNLTGLWVLENNQGSEQFLALTDSTFAIANAIYGGGYSFLRGCYKVNHGKIFMTIDGTKEATVMDIMWMGPRIRMANEKVIFVYHRSRPGESFPQEKKE